MGISLEVEGAERLKFGRIRMSSRSMNLFAQLKPATGLQANTLARFAICLSVRQRGIPNPDEYNKEGSEMAPEVLFGDHIQAYLVLMLSRLKQDRLDPEYYLDEMTRAHLNRGAIGLKQRISNLSDFYSLVESSA